MFYSHHTMATPIDFPQANKTLGAPADRDDTVDPLRVYNDGRQCVSVWQLTEEERAEVARTGQVNINVLMGATQPPIYVWVGPLAKGLF